MPAYLSLAIILLALSSCSTYQYVTLNSPEIPKNDKKEFILENDTMKLTYNFHGQGGPMNVTIFNKTAQPLYVNWKKSALVRYGQTLSLYNRKVEVTGTASTTSFAVGRGVSTGFSDLSASFELPAGIEFIAPSSYISKSLINVLDAEVPDIAAEEKNAKLVKLQDHDGMTTKFKRIVFDEKGSPVQFTSYITFVLGKDANGEFSLKHNFYGMEVLLTANEPDTFGLYTADGDKLYVKQAL
ncbi:hypothetical protein ACX0G9_11620 [Flavitalea flava]